MTSIPCIAGPTLDKKCIWLSDAAPSHEILRKIDFIVELLFVVKIFAVKILLEQWTGG